MPGMPGMPGLPGCPVAAKHLTFARLQNIGPLARLTFAEDQLASGEATAREPLASNQEFVAAAAIDFIDWYHDAIGSSIDDKPGLLAAYMLLMGDRANRSDGKNVRYHDMLWGSGRLKLRRFDSDELDGPWMYYNGSVCVTNGSSVDIYVRQADGELARIQSGRVAAEPSRRFAASLYRAFACTFSSRHRQQLKNLGAGSSERTGLAAGQGIADRERCDACGRVRCVSLQ